MSNLYRDTIEKPSDRVILALDDMTWSTARSVMEDVGPHIGMAKANSLAQDCGWRYTIAEIEKHGLETMADPKFHDIPKTMELSVEKVTSVGAKFITVHASAGGSALEYAVAGRDRALDEMTKESQDEFLGGILGVTVLTSINEDCESIFGDYAEKKVLQFAYLAIGAGLDGIVCSGKELRAIRAIPAFDDLVTVVPGINPKWAKKPGDQKRIVTPSEAIQDGADFIVVGRAITQPPGGVSRSEAAQRISQEIAEVI